MKNIPNPISIFRWETEAELRKALSPQATQSLSTGVREGTGSPNPHPQLLADGEESRPLERSIQEVLKLGSVSALILFFSSVILAILGLLLLHANFRINLSVSIK